MHVVVFSIIFPQYKNFCRFCNITKPQQNEKILISHFTLRTKKSYGNNIIAINEDPNLSHLYGIKDNSVLNDLNYFHVADGLPPDLAHDLFEGLYIVNSVIVSFVCEGLFDGLNEIIFNCGSDKNQKPQLVKVKPQNPLKFKQRACEM